MNQRLGTMLGFAVSLGIAGGLGYLLGYNVRPLPTHGPTALMRKGERAAAGRAQQAKGASEALRLHASTLEREHPSSLTSDQLLQLAAGLAPKRPE
jgi:hypothetical protein